MRAEKSVCRRVRVERKEKVRKKFTTVLLACSMLLLSAAGGIMTGCETTGNGIEPGELPVYASDKKFEVGMWVGISDKIVQYDENGKKTGERPLTDAEFEARYTEIAEAGFTIAFPGYEVMLDGGAYNLKALEAAHKAGIRQMLGDDQLRQLLFNAKNRIDANVITREQCVQEVREVLKKYTESEYASALCGFMIKDEPGANMFDMLSFAEGIFHEAAPDLMFYVNMFPVIADPYQLSGEAGTTVRYRDYLQRWFNKMPDSYVSYDHYPLYGSGISETSFEKSFLYNMDVMQQLIAAEGNNRELWTFLQSISFGSKNRELRSKADASMQALSAVAYGVDCIQWFCYTCPPPSDGATQFGNNALLDRNYEKTPAYGYVQAANGEVQALMPYLGNFEWKGVMLSKVYDDTENFGFLENSPNVITEDKTLTAFSSSEDAFAGVFEDKEGRRGYLAVNFTDPGKNLSNTVKMTLSGYGGAIVVKNGKSSTVRLDNGKLTLDLKSGEGALVIPY